MKKTLMVVALLGAILLSMGVVGYAYAQSQTPPTPQNPENVGQMGGRGRFNTQSATDGNVYAQSEMMQERWAYKQEMQGDLGVGMRGLNAGDNFLQDTMMASLADALGLTPEELIARHDAGETLWDIAEEQGLSVEEIQDLMLTARSTALDQAVVDGTITQEQADWMLDHMSQGWENGTAECDGSGINQSGFQGRGLGNNARP